MPFVLSYFNPVFAKPLYLEMPFLCSQVFNQHSKDEDYQPISDAIEPKENISQENNITIDRNGFLESSTAHNRISRNTHPCVSRVVREFDACRNFWVDKVQCKKRHPTISHVVSTHEAPKCQPVCGFRNATFVTKCPMFRYQTIVNVLYKYKCTTSLTDFVNVPLEATMCK